MINSWANPGLWSKSMNKALLTSVAVIAFVSSASADGWYSSTYGGWNQDDVISAKGVDGQSGYVLGGTVGKAVPAVPGLRIEADVSFRQNEVDVFKFISADHDTTAVLVNAAYDLPMAVLNGRPYVLAGVGFGHTEATFEDISLAKLENSGVAYQLGTGLNWQVAGGILAGVGYRYFQGPDLNVLGTELSDGSNHSVVAQVTFDLN